MILPTIGGSSLKMRHNDMKADIVIVGAGVVGCAIAREMSRSDPKKKIVVLEKNHGPGQETSRFNSNVIHSGLHESDGSLKANFARGGSGLIVNYMTNNGLQIYKTGMIIAIPEGQLFNGLTEKLNSFVHLVRQGRKQGIGLKFLTSQGIKRYEPNIKSWGGVFIPNVWIINVEEFINFLYHNAFREKVQFCFGNEVVGIELHDNQYQVFTPNLKISTRAVINAAGLYADTIAGMAGFEYQLEFWRGEYYEVINSKNKLINGLVYPVVPQKHPSKGIHFSPRVGGRLFVGPNARLIPSRDYYNEDKTPPEVFSEAVRQFCPRIKLDDLRWAYSGIRPKLKNWEKESDFIMKLDRNDPPFINLIGIESPGLTASMAIAVHVGKLLNPWLI